MGATRTQWKLSKSTRPNSQDRCFCQTSKSNSGEPVTISRYRAHHLCLSASKWLIRFQNIMVKYDLFRPLWPSSLTSWHPKLTVLSPFLTHHLRKFAAQSVHSFFKKNCVHNFGDVRMDRRSDERPRWYHYVPASIDWRREA